MNKIKLISIKKLKKGTKKYVAEFKKGDKSIMRKFGAMGMSDYTIHKDSERRNRYINRHKKDLKTNDPTRAGYLSMYILWNKPTYKASLIDYKRRLNKYNKTGKFPKDIKGSSLTKFGVKKMNSVDILGEYNTVDIPSDIRNLINEHLQAMIIQKHLLDKIPKLKIRKSMLKLNISELEDYDYEYNINDETTVDLIRDAYFTLNKSDLKEESWQNFIRNIMNGIIVAQEYELGHPEERANYIISKYYIKLLFDKLEIKYENKFGKSKIPENVINKTLYSKIKNKINASVKRKNRRWGAYDSGRLVKEYKASGGKYENGTNKSKLDRWYKEKWVDACKWPIKSPCGRTKVNQKITYCRPSVKINSKTPKTVQELTKSQIKSRCKKKKKNNLKIVRN